MSSNNKKNEHSCLPVKLCRHRHGARFSLLMVVAGSLPWIERLPSDILDTRLSYPNLSSCVRSFEKYSHRRSTPRDSGLDWGEARTLVFYRLPRTEDLGAVWCLRFRGEVQKSLGTHQSLVYAICSISYKLAPSQLLKSLVHLWTCSPPLLLLTVHRKAGQQQMITTNWITNLGLFANHC